MSQDLYTQGYTQYTKEPVPESQVKSNPPQWRAGYRAAEKNHEARNKVAMKPEKIDRVNYGNLTITWSLITSATAMPRFRRFHKDQRLAPILSLIHNNLWNNRESIKGYVDLHKHANQQFDIVLQYGYDEGILTVDDCAQYDYVPK